MSTLSVVLIKWSLLLAVGWLAHAGLRHRQPRFRLILWRTVLCTGIALPFLQFADFPTLEIQVLPMPAFSEDGGRELGASPLDSSAPSPQTGASLETTGPISSPTMESGIAGPEPRQYRAILFWLIWSFGFGLAALRLVRAGLVLGRLRSRSVPSPPAWQLLADEIRREIAIGLPVTVQSNDAAGAPFVCGIFRPAIVLPSKVDLNLAELEALLRHELAHVRRHDVAWQIAWKWMQAICWFHPMVWPIARAHHLAAEQEADRLASRHERDPSAYAEKIANIALRVVGLSKPESELALNADSQLVQRLKHLEISRMRGWGRSHAVLAFGIAALMVLVGSGWSLVHRQAMAAPAPAASDLGSSQLRIIVLDEKGGAVEGAKVQPYAFRVKGPRSVDHYGWDRSTRPTLVTDEKGETLLEYPAEAFPEEKLLTGQISVTVNHRDFSPTTAHLEIDGPAQPIRLQRGLTVEVTGVGPAGQTVPELSANLSGEPRVVWQTNVTGVLTSRQVSPGNHLLQLTGRLPSGEIVFSDGFAFVAEQGEEPDTFRVGTNELFTVEKGEPYRISLQMHPGIRLEGRLDSNVRRPIKAGRAVISVRPKQYPAYVVVEEGIDLYNKYGAFTFWTSHRPINEDGTFVFESVPPGEVDVVVHGEGFVSRNAGQPRNRTGPIVFGVPQSFALLEPVTRIEIATEPTATLDVTVVTASGEPVEGATVYTGPNVIRMQTGYLGGINPSSEAAFGPVAQLSEVPEAYSGRTDRDGMVVLRDIPAVADSLVVEHPEFEVPLPEPVKKTLRDRFVRFQLSPGEVKELTITVQGKGTDFIGGE